MNNVPGGNLCLTAYLFFSQKLYGLESSPRGEVEIDNVEEEDLGSQFISMVTNITVLAHLPCKEMW